MKKVKELEEHNFGIFKAKTSLWELDNQDHAERVIIDSPHWVSAVVVAPSEGWGQKFVMVKQFRYGINDEILEFPCGIVEKDEEPLDAILRECEEEIGLEKKYVTKIVKLYEKSPNPAFMTNKMTCYYIEVSRIDTSKSHPDADENLTIEFHTEDNVKQCVNHPNASVMMTLAWEKYKQMGA
jgi:ADP-ribose pyrophosphatase